MVQPTDRTRRLPTEQQPLGGEFVLRQGQRDDDGRAVLLPGTDGEHAAPTSLRKLEHELSRAGIGRMG